VGIKKQVNNFVSAETSNLDSEEFSFWSDEISSYILVTEQKRQNCKFLLQFCYEGTAAFTAFFPFTVPCSAAVKIAKKKLGKSLLNAKEKIIENFSHETFFQFSIFIEKIDPKQNLNDFEEFLVKPILIQRLKNAYDIEIPISYSEKILNKIKSKKLFLATSKEKFMKFREPLISLPHIVTQEKKKNNFFLIVINTFEEYLQYLLEKYPRKTLKDILNILFGMGFSIAGLIFIFLLLKMLIYKDFQSKIIDNYITPCYEHIDSLLEDIFPILYADEIAYRKGLILLMRHLKTILFNMNRMHDIGDKYPFTEDPRNYYFKILLSNYFSNMNNHILYLQEFKNIK